MQTKSKPLAKKINILKGITTMKTTKKIISVILACILCLSIAATGVFASGYIGEAKAKEIAFEKAGISADKARFVNCEFDYDNGVAVYDVEFYYNKTEYSCDVNAKTGAIVNFEVDKSDTNAPVVDANYIGKAKAKRIAFKHAGVDASKATKVEVQFDFDNGVAVYEVDFHADKVDYDYEINALTGKIIRAEKEKDIEFSDFALIKWIMSIIEAIKSFFNK